METSDTPASSFCRSTSSLFPSTSPLPKPPMHPPVVHSPCAACKILRRRCSGGCVLAPYFPPTEPLEFTAAHRVFGASNIIKFLQVIDPPPVHAHSSPVNDSIDGIMTPQELPESQRADAASSLVYEANARARDPVYGSAGIIYQLQRQAEGLQSQLARARAELAAMQAQRENLISILSVKPWPFPAGFEERYSPYMDHGGSSSADDHSQASVWEESLWA
ncbi:LOB domain-containing protein [Musa troglodytarum]|uniref:LOB domain-containing protein n=1 Tax=Musa troglodytarum TaxID=320322 RepID=A0A9E7JXC9_9LILI|nr:LOB domain-containing protein [Musa troglodytarum]